MIVSDIGGTKTIIAACELSTAGLRVVFKEEYRSPDFKDFASIVADFRSKHPNHTESLSVGIAGPVFEGRCTATNLPWTVDIHELKRTFGFKHGFMTNDLTAQAWGVTDVGADGLLVISQGESKVGNRALIAAGTGLGESILFAHRGNFIPSGSEGGHTDFGPHDELMIELLQFLLKRHKRVSWERVVSGSMGFANIYTFLLSTTRWQALAPIASNLDSKHYGPAISEAADAGCPLALKTLELFVRMYGAEAGNLALKGAFR
jgi:glucokinase